MIVIVCQFRMTQNTLKLSIFLPVQTLEIERMSSTHKNPTGIGWILVDGRMSCSKSKRSLTVWQLEWPNYDKEDESLGGHLGYR